MKVFSLAVMRFIFIFSLCCYNSLFAQNFQLTPDHNINNHPEGIKLGPGGVESAPECTKLWQVKSSVKYPENAVEAGLEGKVTVNVLVSPEGDVLKIRSVLGPEVFHKEVREKVKSLKFTPVLQNNKPVKVWVTVRFNFRLK